MKKFFCMIIDRITKTSLAEYIDVEATDSYYAQHIAADRYEKETGISFGWYADAIEI